MSGQARKHERAIQSAAVCAAAAMFLATTAQQPVAPQTVPQSSRLVGHVGLTRYSPPQSGVKLLEDIFQRVRSAPQVALAKNLKLQVAAANELQQGLQIRPPKPSPKTVVSQAPTLALLPPQVGHFRQRPVPPSAPAEQSQFADSLSNAFGGASGGAGGASNSGAALFAEPPQQPVIESWLGNKQFPMAQGEGKGISQGMWEIHDEREARSAAVQSKESSRSNMNTARVNGRLQTQTQPPDLATAVGRLYGATRAVEESQKIAANMPQQPMRQRRDSNMGAETTAFKADAKPKPESKMEEGLASADAIYAGPASSAPGSPAAAAGAKRRAEAPAKKKVAEKDKDRAKAGKGSYDGYGEDAEDDGYLAKDRKIAWSPNIALRAPSVATGIPQANIRLGMSESSAGAAIKLLGSMKREKVDKWTVWSWERAASKVQTALQLYMRNGLLDAMRVFDPSLVAPDFGVTMGDNLARVKEKFGEPAFILQEPGPGNGQNYIYPISQVGFQLARPAPNEEPRVVSVLIFNVK